MKTILITTLLVLNSCANYQNGNEAKLISEKNNGVDKEDVTVTASIDEELSTPGFSFVQVEFGNNTEEFLDVKKALIDDPDNALNIVLGTRLKDWATGINNKVKVDRHNQKMITRVITAGAAMGAVASSSRGSYGSAKTYAAVMGGAAVTSSVNQLSNQITDIQRAKIFPENHLYSPFSLPPGLVNKKWILFHHPANIEISKLEFTIFFKNGDEKKYAVDLVWRGN